MPQVTVGERSDKQKQKECDHCMFPIASVELDSSRFKHLAIKGDLCNEADITAAHNLVEVASTGIPLQAFCECVKPSVTGYTVPAYTGMASGAQKRSWTVHEAYAARCLMPLTPNGAVCPVEERTPIQITTGDRPYDF
eukprot:TRINITY_DN67491_c10_g1_i1.p1 TRINITY_DN67491_c10_g1~~TRINITY_DN67491_c10_g1_i1.p1  ORF type:complete len:138 (-),score=3.46 TRINITY_DN67491_c10_g1_i1:254-667(-)